VRVKKKGFFSTAEIQNIKKTREKDALQK